MSSSVVHDHYDTDRSRLGENGMPRRRRSWVAHLGFGLITGVGLGTVGRGFMRLLAADPEFTWSGTLFIVGLFTVFGVVQGAVAAIRSRTTRRWFIIPARLTGGLSYLMLGGGAGVMMVPFLWLGALALWRTGWPNWLRVSLALLAMANMVGVVVMTLTEEGFDRLSEPGVVAGFVVFAATYAATVWAVGPTIGPAPAVARATRSPV